MKLKRILALSLGIVMMVSTVPAWVFADENDTETAETTIVVASAVQSEKNSLSNIKLTESERSWKNPDTKYAELVKRYGKETCPGTLVVATDEDIIFLYAEKEFEKDGMTLESQDTVFDMASVSKVFTAVAVLQLKEKNKLSLDDTLDKYFPEYETGKKITIYNLLHMNSGIADYCNNPYSFWDISGADAVDQKLSDIFLDKISDEEFLQALYKAPLVLNPEPNLNTAMQITTFWLS